MSCSEHCYLSPRIPSLGFELSELKWLQNCKVSVSFHTLIRRDTEIKKKKINVRYIPVKLKLQKQNQSLKKTVMDTLCMLTIAGRKLRKSQERIVSLRLSVLKCTFLGQPRPAHWCSSLRTKLSYPDCIVGQSSCLWPNWYFLCVCITNCYLWVLQKWNRKWDSRVVYFKLFILSSLLSHMWL